MKRINRIAQKDIKKYSGIETTIDEQRFRNLLKRIMEEADKK